jgi:hypothetical protein
MPSPDRTFAARTSPGAPGARILDVPCGSGRHAQEHRGTAVQHVYTAAEVIRMVRAAGFGDVERYGDIAGTPFRVGSPRLLLVARRPMRTAADEPRRSPQADVENAVAAPTQCESADRGAGSEE